MVEASKNDTNVKTVPVVHELELSGYLIFKINNSYLGVGVGENVL